ncbi:hypothetical protein Tsubulata_035619 [Turnera subulata]|uniref:Fucosyltransferase n=1 Tax=Turnera subulata TaxID=218843 RepID=A0A9Q0FFF9_9ROSI|nr:hypothetical protein Tsubulata_035619 [Turnera subulata]
MALHHVAPPRGIIKLQDELRVNRFKSIDGRGTKVGVANGTTKGVSHVKFVYGISTHSCNYSWMEHMWSNPGMEDSLQFILQPRISRLPLILTSDAAPLPCIISGKACSSEFQYVLQGSQEANIDKLLGGLHVRNGFDESKCASRFGSYLYHKASSDKPSPYLISKHRRYEDLHKCCGPDSETYRTALEQLKSGTKNGSTDCNYLVWMSYSGLGNRI